MKTIRKITSLIIVLSLVLALGLNVSAAGGGTVETLNGSVGGSKLHVSGTTQNVLAAVVVQALQDDKTVGMSSFTVNGSSFSGDITLSSEYDPAKVLTVRAADYDGNNNTWKTIEVTTNAAVLKGYKLRLDGYIGVDFYLELAGSLQNTNTVVTFSYDSVYPANKVQEAQCTGTPVSVDGHNYYKFSCKINSVEMNLPISATLKNEQANVEVEFDDFYVRNYALYLINHNDPATDLAKALLSYGYYCQANFNLGGDTHPEDALTLLSYDACLTAIRNVSPAVQVPSIEGNIDYAGSSVGFLSGAQLKHFFTVTGTDAKFFMNGEEVTATNNKTYKVIATDEIKIKLAADKIPCSIQYGDTTKDFSYSTLDYMAAVLNSSKSSDNLKKLAVSYYMYYDAAVNYNPNA